MVDFVPEPRERLEAPICKAIESRDFKQALKFVDKRLAKNSDPYLLVCIQSAATCTHLRYTANYPLWMVMSNLSFWFLMQ